ncbi:ATP-binding protein [soil metagenome]
MNRPEPPPPTPLAAPASLLPDWARELILLYESGASGQFILYGNVNDRMGLPVLTAAPPPPPPAAALSAAPATPVPATTPATPHLTLGSLTDFISRVLLPRFDVVLSYDLGSGIRVEKGGDLFAQWPTLKAAGGKLPDDPRAAIEAITQFLRYAANLSKVGQRRLQVAVFIRSASLLAPAVRGGVSYDLAALALDIRDWASDQLLADHPIATFLIAENLSDLHPLIVNNPRASRIEVPLPRTSELAAALASMSATYPRALANFAADLAAPAAQLTGATLSAVEAMLKTKEYVAAAITQADLADLKRELVEKDTQGLIEFIQPDRSLDDLVGQEAIKSWLREDIALWNKNDLNAMPMGYLICGPVGTGKTYMVECLAGSAGVPVVKLKNFRDRWVGSTEGNLETIFRLLHALGRCYVFIDEADQALGKRSADSSDSGVGGRVYSMMAEEMSNTRNRGRIVWVLASSRPDLIEVDLKRPGRVDVKIPLFPTTTPEEGFGLIRALLKKRGMVIDKDGFASVKEIVPDLLTPGAAEALAVKVYRAAQTKGLSPLDALQTALKDYRAPVAPEVMAFQIGLAVNEASDAAFVPERFR